MTGIEINRLICKIVNAKNQSDKRLNCALNEGISIGFTYETLMFYRDTIDELYNIITNKEVL